MKKDKTLSVLIKLAFTLFGLAGAFFVTAYFLRYSDRITMYVSGKTEEVQQVLDSENYQIAFVYAEPTNEWEIIETQFKQNETENFKFVNGSNSLGSVKYFYKKRKFKNIQTPFYNYKELSVNKIDKEPISYIIKTEKGSYELKKNSGLDEYFNILDSKLRK